MKPIYVALSVSVALFALASHATRAAALPQAVHDACWRQAQRVLPALTAREREAYIANCLADATYDRDRKRYRRVD